MGIHVIDCPVAEWDAHVCDEHCIQRNATPISIADTWLLGSIPEYNLFDYILQQLDNAVLVPPFLVLVYMNGQHTLATLDLCRGDV